MLFVRHTLHRTAKFLYSLKFKFNYYILGIWMIWEYNGFIIPTLTVTLQLLAATSVHPSCGIECPGGNNPGLFRTFSNFKSYRFSPPWSTAVFFCVSDLYHEKYLYTSRGCKHVTDRIRSHPIELLNYAWIIFSMKLSRSGICKDHSIRWWILISYHPTCLKWFTFLAPSNFSYNYYLENVVRWK